MHKIIMLVGGITAALGVLFIGLMIAVGSNSAGLLAGLGLGAGFILSGAMLYCFGAIVDHLRAIRRVVEARPDTLRAQHD